MSDFFGYADFFTDRPNHWFADGYVSVSDGYGTPVLAPPNGNVLSGIVKSITRTGVGAYTLTLSQAPVAQVWGDVKSLIPLGLSPAYVGCQLRSSTVGQASAGANPTWSWQFNVAGVATELPQGSGFWFGLCLIES